MDPTTTTKTTTARLFAGVDVSKDRLDVCLRWSEPESHEKEETFGLTPIERTIPAYATAVSSIVDCSYSDGLREPSEECLCTRL